MAAGLGFKTFTTGEVLTAADVNGYLMQGILVFATEAARDSAITAPQEGQFAFTKDNNSLWYYTGSAWVASGATGDIEGVTAGVGISGGGTSGTVTITNSMATAIDAKGDLIPGTGADTFSRLPVGANGTVLTADSAESTGLKWATPSGSGQNFSLLSSATPSGSTYTVSSLSGYGTIVIVWETVGGDVTPFNMTLRVNTLSTNIYNRYFVSLDAPSSYSANSLSSSASVPTNTITLAGSSSNASSTVSGYAYITGANTAGKKIVTHAGGGTAASGTGHDAYWGAASIDLTAVISSISLICTGNNFSGGNVKVYGSVI